MPLDYTFERQIMLERQEGFREGYIQGCKERRDWAAEEYMQLYW